MKIFFEWMAAVDWTAEYIFRMDNPISSNSFPINLERVINSKRTIFNHSNKYSLMYVCCVHNTNLKHFKFLQIWHFFFYIVKYPAYFVQLIVLCLVAVIFVIDSNNIERITEAHEELAKLMAEKRLKDALLLIYANKQVQIVQLVLNCYLGSR